MYKIGVVTALDEGKARARVQFDDMDGVLSYWLPITHHKTLKDKAYWMPDINEHVACLLDENGEEGVVLGAVYSDADPVPVSSKDKHHVTFEDGTVIEYDRQSHKLTADIKGDIDVKATGKCDVECTGNIFLKSASNITLQAPSLTMKGCSPANAVFEGTFRLQGELIVEGNINATGSIIDGGGNTNHHGH